MHNFIYLKKFTKVVSFIIITIILLSSLNPFANTYIEAADNRDWVIIDGDDSIYTESSVKNNYIRQVLYHNKRTNENRYETADYFTMTLEEYDLNNSFTSGANASVKKANIYRTVSNETQGDQVVSTYVMTRSKFLYAATSLGVTADMILDNGGSLTVYLQTTFKIYKGDNLLGTAYGRHEMLAAGVKYFGGWSATTQERIPSFYNMPYTLTASNVYDVNVIAIDEDGKELMNLTPSDTEQSKAIAGQEYTNEIDEANDSISVDGINYTFQNQWKYSYIKRGETNSTDLGKNDVTNNKIYFSKMPDASSMTIYLIYEPDQTKPYWVDFEAIDEDGTLIRVLDDEGYEVHFGETYTYDVPDSWKTLQEKYYYQSKWYLTYIDRETEEEITTSVTNMEDISKVMPDAKYYSRAKFRLVYAPDPLAITPTPIPTPGTPTPTPEIPEIIVPESNSEHLDFTTQTITGKIRADDRGGEKFIAMAGVPTTESLYGEVRAKDYLLGYTFIKKVGIKNYTIEVKKDYILNWESATPEEVDGPVPITETVTVTERVTVPRAYGYWEIEDLECYKIDYAVMQNYALPDGSIIINPNYSYYNPPSISYSHSGKEDYHIIPPEEADAGITLPSEIISSTADNPASKPILPYEEFYNEAEYIALVQTGNINVKSDSLTFNGNTVISDVVSDTEASDINTSVMPQCNTYNSNVLYKSNQVIEETKKNGTYPSTGTITYASIAKVSSNRTSTPCYSVQGINKVTIHTPVVCNPTITADNDNYVQLLNPTDGCVQLVLDPDTALSDFVVNISNTGFHHGIQGYFTRDFSKSLRNPLVSYITTNSDLLRNEVKFPFDVFIDIGKDNNQENDDYITSGTWITIDRASPRFYLPMWTREDVYTVDFRTVAVNGLPYIDNTQEFANTDLNRYVATNTLKVEISGRIYGLTLYDITDYPMWEETFRVKNSMKFKFWDTEKYPDGTDKSTYNANYSYTYTLGTNDQYGNDTGRDIKYTFPLVNGSHPFYKNQGILKTGYKIRFSLETIGNMFSDGCSVMIKPSFYFVDKDGKNRQAVDLYYTEEIDGKSRHLVKVGSGLDKINIKKDYTGSIYQGIPEKELENTAKLRGGDYGALIWQREAMFNFEQIWLTYAWRTYVGQEYADKIKTLSSFQDIVDAGIAESAAEEAIQRWYGAYYIPNEVHVVAKGFDVMDYADKYGVDNNSDFWLEDGYIIINLNINTIDETGKNKLSYTNATNYRENGNCCMWIMEGAPLSKSSYKGPTFNFYAGDFFIYYSNKKMSNDYTVESVY